jgi:hypothetical protein
VQVGASYSLVFVNAQHQAKMSDGEVYKSTSLSGVFGYQTAPRLQETPKNLFKYSLYVIYCTDTVMYVRYAHLTGFNGFTEIFKLRIVRGTHNARKYVLKFDLCFSRSLQTL